MGETPRPPLPWKYLRRHLAEKWRMTPWQVDDEAPFYEVEAEVTIMALEGMAKQQQDRKARPDHSGRQWVRGERVARPTEVS